MCGCAATCGRVCGTHRHAGPRDGTHVAPRIVNSTPAAECLRQASRGSGLLAQLACPGMSAMLATGLAGMEPLSTVRRGRLHQGTQTLRANFFSSGRGQWLHFSTTSTRAVRLPLSTAPSASSGMVACESPSGSGELAALLGAERRQRSSTLLLAAGTAVLLLAALYSVGKGSRIDGGFPTRWLSEELCARFHSCRVTGGCRSC